MSEQESRIVTDNTDKNQFARVSMETTPDSPNANMTREEALERTTTPESPNPLDASEENLLAGKYKSVEDIEKAYNELQTKLGQKGEETTEPTTETQADTTSESDVFERAYSEWAEKGEVSEDTIDQIVKDKGIPKQYVEQFIRQSSAEETLLQNSIMESVGGRDEYTKITEWAVNNLPQTEIDAYNKIIESGDVEQIKFALNALSQKRGSTKFIQPDKNNTFTDSNSFNSKAEMVQAMKDPRYEKDLAYRQKVERMIMRSRL